MRRALAVTVSVPGYARRLGNTPEEGDACCVEWSRTSWWRLPRALSPDEQSRRLGRRRGRLRRWRPRTPKPHGSGLSNAVVAVQSDGDRISSWADRDSGRFRACRLVVDVPLLAVVVDGDADGLGVFGTGGRDGQRSVKTRPRGPLTTVDLSRIARGYVRQWGAAGPAHATAPPTGSLLTFTSMRVPSLIRLRYDRPGSSQ